MLEYLLAGGPVMIPIGLCSVIALAVFIERLWALRPSNIAPVEASDQVISMLREGRFADAEGYCSSHDVAMTRVLGPAIALRDHSRDRIRERVEELGRREVAEMERFVPVLGTVASISPLLGLLGTVGGMIMTFQVIQEQGLGNVGSLAGGISQALVTTFAGLCVGIPALVANRYVLARIDAMLLDLEETASRVIELLVADVGGATR